MNPEELNVKDEYESIRSVLRGRGNVPNTYDDAFRGSGYALVDLDGDGQPELLLLSSNTYYAESNQPYMIDYIYTIREGRIVRIEYNYELRCCTELTADSTFYNWKNGSFPTLTAYRLEASKTALSPIWEAKSALSFEDGEIPVPYWVKTENGEEIYITKDEFELICEHYICGTYADGGKHRIFFG